MAIKFSSQFLTIFILTFLMLVLAGCVITSPVPTSTIIPPTVVLTQTHIPSPTFTPTITPTPVGGGSGKFVFVSERDGNPEIYVMNADGSNETRLTYNPYEDIDPQWSPDGKKIVFQSFRDPDSNIYVMNADGSQQTNLTKYSKTYSSVSEPKWSPDGKKIGYVLWKPGQEKISLIYTMNPDGSEHTLITNSQYLNGDFEWSPDSAKIAFDSSRNGRGDIYVINADGSGELKLTNNPKSPNFVSYNLYPSWSPDGKKIIYLSTNSGIHNYYEIYSINADGTDETRLTRTSNVSEFLGIGSHIWSSDGKKFVFSQSDYRQNPVYVICVMNLDGSEKICLNNDPSENNNPQWSPDGQKIAFTSERDGQLEIYIMNADGSAQTRLTKFSVYERWLWQFQWSP